MERLGQYYGYILYVSGIRNERKLEKSRQYCCQLWCMWPLICTLPSIPLRCSSIPGPKFERKLEKIRLRKANDRANIFLGDRRLLTLYDRELLEEHKVDVPARPGRVVIVGGYIRRQGVIIV